MLRVLSVHFFADRLNTFAPPFIFCLPSIDGRDLEFTKTYSCHLPHEDIILQATPFFPACLLLIVMMLPPQVEKPSDSAQLPTFPFFYSPPRCFSGICLIPIRNPHALYFALFSSNSDPTSPSLLLQLRSSPQDCHLSEVFSTISKRPSWFSRLRDLSLPPIVLSPHYPENKEEVSLPLLQFPAEPAKNLRTPVIPDRNSSPPHP